MAERHFIPYAPPLIEEDDIAEVVACLKSGWLTTGPRVERLQKEFAKLVDAKYAVCTSSCTMALHIAMLLAGVGRGDEVLTTPFTFASSAHVIRYVDAMPVFCDVEEATFNIDPARMRELLTTRYEMRHGNACNKETGARLKAVVPVHYGGHPCDMDAILELAAAWNLRVIEDAAHAVGALYKGKPVGGIGDLSCFSFYATKNICTAEGGMLTTNNPEWAERARCLTMYGISDARQIWNRYAPQGTWGYDVSGLGLKCNMPDLLAALGLTQLAKFNALQERRARHAAIYQRILGEQPNILLPHTRQWARHAWHLYPIRLTEGGPQARDAFIAKLRERNIGTSVLFIPLHLHSYYRALLGGNTEGMFPVAERVFAGLINLPIAPAISEEDIVYIAETVKSLL